MSQKKIVSIEDRIPKLKQERKKKTNRRLIFYISIFFILISIVVYLQSSLSHVQRIEIFGNEYVAKLEIQELTSLSDENSFWSVDKDKVAEDILQHPEIKSATVDKVFPTTIRIEVDEYLRVGYVFRDQTYYPLLESGAMLTANPLQQTKGDAPLLRAFDNNIYLKEMSNELAKLPTPIVDLISEIHLKPTEGNPYKIWLYMNDGFEVENSIRNFSETMVTYPSISAQLDNNRHGVIRMGDGGAVFDPLDSELNSEENVDEIEG